MAQKTRKEQNQQEHLLDSPKEDDELELLGSPKSLYVHVYEMAERFAETRIGQFVIERGDRVLRMIEDTAKWSLPQDKSECKLERPMPWIPFLALIIVLRVIRIWLTMAAIMIGNGPVTPYEMVFFIQTRRRKLRSLRVHGLKAIRRREMQANALRSTSTTSAAEASLMCKMRELLSRAICRPGQHCEPERSAFVHRVGNVQISSDEPTSSERQTTKRPRDDEQSDSNLTFDQMLTKYANENSDDDSDFIPNPEDETNEDDDESSSSSAENSTDDDDDELETETENLRTIPALTEKTQQNNKHAKSIVIKENGGAGAGGGFYHKVVPKPIIELKTEPISDVESSAEKQQSQSKKHVAKNINDKRETEVAQKNLKNNNLPKLAKILNVATNGNGYEEKTTATGLASAAITLPTLNITANAAPIEYDNEQILYQTISPLTPILEIPTTPEILPVSDDIIMPSPATPTTTPKTLAASKLTNDNDNDNICEPRTPMQPIPNNFESATLTSASSSEDIFYSPIAQPTLNVEQTQDGVSKDETLTDVPKKHVQHQSLPRQQYQNRYRGRNRH